MVATRVGIVSRYGYASASQADSQHGSNSGFSRFIFNISGAVVEFGVAIIWCLEVVNVWQSIHATPRNQFLKR